MAARYRNGWWLEVKYHEEGLTQREIADECEVSPRTVRKYMKRFEIETREVAGENHGLAGRKRDPETKQRISETLQGREFSEEARERMAEAHEEATISAETRQKISSSLAGTTRPEETRLKMSESRMGEDNPLWRGGVSRSYGKGWERAKQAVNERDEVCQNCRHDGTVDQLEVHHIVPFRLFDQSDEADRSDAHDLGNLVLLCQPCHRKAERGELEFESSLEPPE